MHKRAATDRHRYIGNFYDVAKHSIVRLLWGLAEELRELNVATVALAPGFMRENRAGDVTRRRGDGLEEDTMAEKEWIAGVHRPSGGGARS